MKQKLGYKNKRSIIVLAIIIALLVLVIVGVNIFNKGNGKIEAISSENISSEQSNQEENNDVENNDNSEQDIHKTDDEDQAEDENNKENINKDENNENKDNQENNNIKNNSVETKNIVSTNVSIAENANNEESEIEEIYQEEYVTERVEKRNILVGENYTVNWERFNLNANTSTKALSIYKPIIEAEKRVNQTEVSVGDELTYSIMVVNKGNLSDDLVVKDSIPDGTDFIENSIEINNEKTQYGENDLINGIIYNLDPESEMILSFKVTVNGKINSDIRNTAYANDVPTETISTSVNSEIVFYENGGTDVEDMYGYAGDEIEDRIMPTTTRDGYEFIGWYEESEFVNKEDSLPEEYPAGKTEYWAKWEAKKDTKYVVEYYYQKDGKYSSEPDSTDPRTGETDTTVYVTEDDKVASKDGYVFDNAEENVLSGNVEGDGSLKLKVYFKQQFKVIYEPGEKGNFEKQEYDEIDYGDETPEFVGDKTAIDGYHFVGWDKEIADNVTEDVVYTAKWEADKDTLYVVEYYYQKDGKYSSNPDSTDPRTGETDTTVYVTEEDKVASKDGYVFDNAEENVLSGNVEGDGSLKLKVHFKQQFKVTYNPGTNGTFEEEIIDNIIYGQETPECSKTITGNDGYYFAGWDKEIADNVTEDVVYTALWEKLEISKTRTNIIDLDEVGNIDYVDQAGDIIEYTIIVKNKGDISAENIVLVDNHKVTVKSVKANGVNVDISKRSTNTFNANENLLNNLNIVLEKDKSIEVVVEYTVTEGEWKAALKTENRLIINQVTAALNNHNYTTTDKTDGKDGTDVKGKANVNIKKTASSNVDAGKNISYTITVDNTGNEAATVIVTDELKGTTYVDGTAKIGNNEITPNIDVNSSGNQVLSFEVTLDAATAENPKITKVITFEAKTSNYSYDDIINTAKIKDTDKSSTATTEINEIDVIYNEYTEGQTGKDLNIIFIVDNSSSMNEPVKGESYSNWYTEAPVAPDDLSKTKFENAKTAINSYIESQKTSKYDNDISVVVFNTSSTGNTSSNDFLNLKTLIKNDDIYVKSGKKYTKINNVEYEIDERKKVKATDNKEYYYLELGIDYGARLIGTNSISNDSLKESVSALTISNDRSGFATYINPVYKLINNNKSTYLSNTKKNIIIVLADGQFSNSSYQGQDLTDLKNNLKATKAGGAIYCIGYGSDYNERELKIISTNNKCTSAEDSDDLFNLFGDIEAEATGKEKSGKTSNGVITFSDATKEIKVSETCPIVALRDTGKKDSKGDPILEEIFEAKTADDLKKYGLTVSGKKLKWDAKIYAKNNLKDDETLPNPVYFKYYIPRDDS